MSVHHERMIEATIQRLKVGCPIFTSEGEIIGTLSEVKAQHLKVDAPMKRDFWIDAAYVTACDSKRIELAFTKSELGAYRVSDPGHEGLSPESDRMDPQVNVGESVAHPVAPFGVVQPGPLLGRDAPVDLGAVAPQRADRTIGQSDAMTEQRTDLITSEHEQIETRMRMEAKLAEQRRHLDHAHQADGDTRGTIGEPVEDELARLESEYGPVEEVRPSGTNGSSRWMWFTGVAALLGIAGAGLMMRRRRQAQHPIHDVAEHVRDLPALAETGLDAARSALREPIARARGEIADAADAASKALDATSTKIR